MMLLRPCVHVERTAFFVFVRLGIRLPDSVDGTTPVGCSVLFEDYLFAIMDIKATGFGLAYFDALQII